MVRWFEYIIDFLKLYALVLLKVPSKLRISLTNFYLYASERCSSQPPPLFLFEGRILHQSQGRPQTPYK